MPNASTAAAAHDLLPWARLALSSAMFTQISRLARQSFVYGLGGLISRILAVLLLPLYTRYLLPRDYGAIETLVALSAVLVTVLRVGLPSAFFRFYFDTEKPSGRLTLVRTSFWFTMGLATLGLVAGTILAGPISQALFGSGARTRLVQAAFVGLWAQMNYEQLTALFRVEQRSLSFVLASVANVLITVGASLLLVVGLHRGATGVLVANFSGTLTVYLVLLVYRRTQLGLEFDRGLLWRMNRFGLPLMPAALALWVINFADRLFLVELSGPREVGLYSIGVRISSALLLLLIGFSTAWPAFAYSIDDDREARRTYSFILTYLLLISCWLSLAVGLLAPWIVRLLTTSPFYSGSRVVAPLVFGLAAYAGYTVLAIGIGRTKRTQFNWVVTGSAAFLNTVLNVMLIPPYGMMGAAIATVAAYVAMFVAMAWYSQRIYPVPYQWRRVLLVTVAAVALTVAGKAAHASLPWAVSLTLAYPLLLGALGFYLPEERARLRRLAAQLTPGRS
jgi:O-antigen/teichoic acid export membrane protein